MKKENTYELRSIPDDRLLARLKSLVATDCQTQAALLAHIGEVDARKLYCARGYSSMFGYCTAALHLSEAAAYKRIAAARAARRFPAIYEAVAAGRVHLSGIAVLAPHLTAANHAELLRRATHQTKRAIEQLVVTLAPKPDVAPSVRKLPERANPTPLLARATAPDATTSRAAPTPARPRPPAVVQPLAPRRFKIQLTVDQDVHDQFRRVQALLRHRMPDGNPATILAMALGALEHQLMKGKFALTDRPRTSVDEVAPTPGSRHIPAAVRRAVRERDGLRCTFVSDDGVRCDERGGLEFHHVHPHGKGGPATVDNVRLVCRAHNVYLGELEYGAAAMRPSRAREAPAVTYWTGPRTPCNRHATPPGGSRLPSFGSNWQRHPTELVRRERPSPNTSATRSSCRPAAQCPCGRRAPPPLHSCRKSSPPNCSRS